ncbi:hypothetical protein LTR17_000643 [Elasticomyces elasticus]|nr:hypothetical protein LTR17_000643 [Elasticomyces elasticus]
MDMPYAPMPPPPPFPPGAVHMDDWQGPMASPLGYDNPGMGLGDPLAADPPIQSKPKKNKNKSKNIDNGRNDQTFAGFDFNNDRIEPSFRGSMLMRAPAQPGQKETWARVCKQDLPVDDTKLIANIKAHRLRTRTSPVTDFSDLGPNQRSIINRLIAQYVLHETNANAEWILADVQKFGTKRLGTWVDVKKLQVILKRQDKDFAKVRGMHSSNATKYYEFGEIIDLAEPVLQGARSHEDGGVPKKSKKKQQQQQQQEQAFEDSMYPVDEPYERAAGAWDQREPVRQNRNVQHNQQYQDIQQPRPIYDDPMQQPMQQPMMPNLGDPLPYQPDMPMPPPPQQPYPQGQNPFMPNANIAVPGQFDQPSWQGDQQQYHPRAHTPAADHKRSTSTRRLRKLETDMESMRRKVNDWDLSSGESNEGRDSIFTDPRTGGTRTPVSSLPSEDMFPRGEYESRKRDKDRETEHRPRRYREERRYRDEHVDIEPAYNYGRRRDSRNEPESPRHRVRYIEQRRETQRSPVREREREQYFDPRPSFEPGYERASRPQHRRSQTYDDYPMPRSAIEPRYLPSTPPRVQRRLTDYPSESHQYADYDEQHRSRRRRDSLKRSPQGRTLEYEALQAIKAVAGAARREEARYGRRQNAAEPSGGYYN